MMVPDYEHSILNVTASILTHYKASTPYKVIPSLMDSLTGKKHVVLILLDGMGINVLYKHLFKDAFLFKHLKETITSVFPTTTVAATTSVLSGLPPYASGHVGWVQYFIKEDQHVAIFPNEHFYDRSCPILFNYRDKYLKYHSIYEHIKRASPHVSLHELFPNFREDGYASFKDQINKVIENTHKKEETFSYVYWTEPDATEHLYGIEAYATRKVLEELDQEVERLAFFSARQTAIIVIADHGLIDVTGIPLDTNEILMNMMRKKPSIESRATTYYVKKHLLNAFKEQFNMDYGKYFTLLSKEELYNSKLLGEGKKHKMLDQFIGDFISIATDKYMMMLNNDRPFLAHHAGLTKDELEVPLIIFTK